jgi:hypothetical protein
MRRPLSRRVVRRARDRRLIVFGSKPFLRTFFLLCGLGHLVVGIAGAACPRWFFDAVPPWPPLHVGQIQIAGVFDLSMATAFLVAATDVQRYAGLVILVGVVGEGGHALVRIGHVIAGDNPPADLVLPSVMVAVAVILAIGGIQRRAQRS